MILIASAVCNAANFGALYALMPGIPVLVLLGVMLITPSIYNGLLYYKNQSQTHFIALPVITSISYGVFGQFLTSSGKLEAFKTLATQNTGDLIVSIDQNIVGPSQILFLLLFQFAVLFVIKLMTRRKDNDRSFQVEQKVSQVR